MFNFDIRQSHDTEKKAPAFAHFEEYFEIFCFFACKNHIHLVE